MNARNTARHTMAKRVEVAAPDTSSGCSGMGIAGFNSGLPAAVAENVLKAGGAA